MSEKKIRNIIAKYFDKELSSEELKELLVWLNETKNLKVFEEYVTINYLTNKNFKKFHTIQSFKAAIKRIDKSTKTSKIKKVHTFNKNYFKYAAAVIILLITIPFIFNKITKDENNVPAIINHTIAPGSDKAVLTLEDGNQIKLKKGVNYSNNNVRSNGENLIYNTSEESEETKITYNYLTVPRGGQFYVELADDTKVWLNSESKIKYPTTFIKGKLRAVELLYGEAYFDVSKSVNYERAGFNVKTKTQDVKVLGTQFNIKAYPSDDLIYTTLIEGEVLVSNGVESAHLNPGFQSRVSIKNDNLNISKVDVSYETAWRNGLFMFKNERLDNIMATLSRWYDVEVTFNDQTKKNLIFSGQLKRTSNINDMISKIEKTGDIEFNIKNKKIIIQ